MSQLTDLVEIKSLEQQLVFTGTGDFAKQETVLHETAGGVSYLKNEEPGNIIQGKFSLTTIFFLFLICFLFIDVIENLISYSFGNM